MRIIKGEKDLKSMKRMKRKLVAVLLVAILFVSNTIFSIAESGITPQDTTGATIIVSDEVVAAGEVADVTIGLVNNPGIVSMKLNVNFDSSAMKLVSVEDKGNLGATVHSNQLINPYVLSWANDTASENLTFSGDIVTLKFEIPENVEDGTVLPIEITYDLDNYDICNVDLEKVEFAIDNGSVTVGKAEATPVADFTYELSGNEMIITEYIGTATKVIIDSVYTISGVEYTVVGIAASAFEANTEITSVVIPETVKTIGDYAFYDCTALTDVTIYSTDVEIGEVALGYYYISRREDGIVEGFTIHGYAGSTAEAYAADSEEITFVVMEEKDEPVVQQANVSVLAMNSQTFDTVNVTLTGAGTYNVGDTVTVSAGKKVGFEFLGWYAAVENGFTGDALCADNEYSFEVTADTSLVAVYEYIGSGRLRVFGAGFKVNNGVTQSIYNYAQDFTIGERVTLTAIGDNFAYWMNESNKIVTENKELTFTIAGDTALTVVYKNATENTAYVEFVSAYGQVMQAQNYSSDSDIQIPGAVNKDGYKFISWSLTAEEIARQISEGTTYIRVTPVYEALSDTFTITTIYDGDEANAEVVEGYTGYQFKQFTAKTIAGRTFSHWSDSKTGGTVLSTSESYSIYINKNITVYAIYVDEGTDVTKVSTMITNDISTKLLNETTKSLVVLATRDIMDGYTLIEHGILYSGNSAYGVAGAEDTMVIGATGVAKGVSTATGACGTYAHTITLTEEQLDVTVYARGYMILEDNEGNQITIYGSILSGSYNGLN